MSVRMILRFFKRFSPEWRTAQIVYDQAVADARAPRFYRDLGVPDTLDGRFDMIAVHVVAAMRHDGPNAGRFNQALFDVMILDMQRSLTEMGVGDLSIPKKVRALMRAFNGRLYAYRSAVAPGASPDGLLDAVRRNIYGTTPNPRPEDVAAITSYIRGILVPPPATYQTKASA